MMIYLIYPEDPTTSFLDEILKTFTPSIEEGKVCLIACKASDDSYEEAKEKIRIIPENAKVIFMGHGTPSVLYGGAKESYLRQPLISLKEMHVFSNKTLILMSCYSTQLLESSRALRGFSDSIGFGLLPSDLSETIGKTHLEKLELDDSDIANYQKYLVEIFSRLTDLLLNSSHTTEQIVNKLRLLINTKINVNLLELNDYKLANLLYFTNAEIHHD